jgi:hypothetical protein
MSCKPVEISSRPLGEKSVIAIQLHAGDGALATLTRRFGDDLNNPESHRNSLSQPLLLVNARFPTGRPLPITVVEAISAQATAYSSFAKRYVLVPRTPSDSKSGRSENWPSGRPQPVYLMTSQGDVEKIQVPSKPDWTTIILAMPVVRGLSFLGSGAYANEWGGVFLYDNKNTWALDRGKAEALAVSPDGCKVAYSIFNDYGKSKIDIARVKSIDFCGG